MLGPLYLSIDDTKVFFIRNSVVWPILIVCKEILLDYRIGLILGFKSSTLISLKYCMFIGGENVIGELLIVTF